MGFGTLEATYVNDATVESGGAPIGRTNTEIPLEAGPYTINLDVATKPPSIGVVIQPDQKATIFFSPVVYTNPPAIDPPQPPPRHGRA